MKELYLLSFESRLELTSSHSRADGKETHTVNLTKKDSSKGRDPQPSQDSKAKESTVGLTPGERDQR